MDRIDIGAASQLAHEEFTRQISEIVSEILAENRLQLNSVEQQALVDMLVNDMLGLGPLEPLLQDPTISDILVNTHKQVYVERRGKLELTNVTFKDNTHLLRIIDKIVSQVGRRVDESSPMVDARLTDGSRVNAIIAPLAPGFYLLPRTIEDLVDFMAGKLLDLVGVPHDLATRWEEHLHSSSPKDATD